LPNGSGWSSLTPAQVAAAPVKTIRADMAYPLILLCLACIHEFAWQFAAAGYQRDMRDLTQWGLILALCIGLHVIVRHRLLSAVCAAIAIMSSTTAACAAWWLMDSTIHQCSMTYGAPTMLLSAFAALAVFWGLRDDRR
jgi:hypothetical protein